MPVSTEPTTDSVIDRVRAGDVDAYAEVVRTHQTDVWRVVAWALRDGQAAEDLVQQVFVDAYVKLERYETGRDLGAWLRGIARNRVREELRRRAREDRRMEAYCRHVEARLGDAERAEREQEAMRAALAACREGLAETAREALVMRYERSLGFEEIARALDRTVAATRQLLQRTRLSLRSCIEGRLGRS